MKEQSSQNTEPQHLEDKVLTAHSGSKKSCQKLGFYPYRCLPVRASRRWVAAIKLKAEILQIEINCNLSAKLFPKNHKCSNKLQNYNLVTSQCFFQYNCYLAGEIDAC